MSTQRMQFLISTLFLLGYFALITFIIFAEVSDDMNMKKGSNSLMGEIKILIGVLTGAIAQILNFWFNKDNSNPSQLEELVKKIGEASNK